MNGRFALNCWAYHQTSMPIAFIAHAGGIIMSNIRDRMDFLGLEVGKEKSCEF